MTEAYKVARSGSTYLVIKETYTPSGTPTNSDGNYSVMADGLTWTLAFLLKNALNAGATP